MLDSVEKARVLYRGDRDDLRGIVRLLSDTLTARGARAFKNAVMTAMTGDPQLGWEGLTIPIGELSSLYEAAFVRAGRAESAILRSFQVDLSNPRVIDYLRNRSAANVVGINSDTKEALRIVLGRGATNGLTPELLVPRISKVIGLSPRDAQAVENLRSGLRSQGVSGARIERMASTYSKRLLEQRAMVIARTEVVDAIEFARQETWEQAVEAGLVQRSDIWRVWVTAEDERVCPVCAPLDGARSRLGGSFHKGGQTALRPPAHPNCRCSVDYEVANLKVQKHGGGSHNDKDHGNWARGGGIAGVDNPSKQEPGAIPIPDGYVRLYHYTRPENLERIIEGGLTLSTAKGNTYGEPNMIWASAKQPRWDSHFIEFAVPIEWLRPFGIEGGKAGVGAVYQSDRYTPESYMASGNDIGFFSNIGRENFVLINRPDDNVYRSLYRDPSYRQQVLDDVHAFDWLMGMTASYDRAVMMARDDIRREGTVDVKKHGQGSHDDDDHGNRGGDRRLGAGQRLSHFRRPDGKPLNRNEIGDTYEDALIHIGLPPKTFTTVGHLSGSANRTYPYDVVLDDYAVEVKTVHAKSTTWKATIKGHELKRKYEQAKADGKRPATLIQVVNQESFTVSVYLFRDEYASRSVKRRTPDWVYHYTSEQFMESYERQGYRGDR